MFVEVKNISKSFGQEKVLDCVNLSVEQGQIVGIVGKNGSGKTMLFKCICGFVAPTLGEVVVQNKVIGKDVDFAPDMGVMIETPGFLPYYSGFQNLKMLASLRNKINDQQIKDTMKMCGLDPNNKKSVHKYSLGMRQRLGFAQAIMEDPDFLVLDEPMNGLDNDGILEARALLSELSKRGKTILLTSHNHEDIEALCDSVYEMDKGRISSVEK